MPLVPRLADRTAPLLPPLPRQRRGGRVPRWALIGSAALGLIAASLAMPGAVSEGAPAAVPDDMLVVDVGALTVEEQLTFAALQGIVNRSGPRLYLVGIRSAQDFDVDPTAEAWLADVVDVPFERVTPDEALDRLIAEANGMVVWDPAVPYESQNVATTIAGRDDLLPVGPDQVDDLAADHGLTVEVDLRDLAFDTDRQFTEWAIANLEPPPGGWSFPVWIGRPRNANPIQPGLRDWAVANRAFVFDADPATEPGLIGEVIDLFPRGTGVYGYVFFDTEVYYSTGLPVNEALGVAELTDRGNWLIPTTDATNMTVHQQSTEVARPATWDDSSRTPDDDTTYVSFVISDGDALGYDVTLLRSLQYPYLDDSSIPIGISTSPLLATRCTSDLELVPRQPPGERQAGRRAERLGLRVPVVRNGGRRDPVPRAVSRRPRRHRAALHVVDQPHPHPVAQHRRHRPDRRRARPVEPLPRLHPAAPISPAVSFVGDVPVTRVAMATKPEEIAPAIRASIAKQPDGPRFVSIGLVTWGNNADDAAAAIARVR